MARTNRFLTGLLAIGLFILLLGCRSDAATPTEPAPPTQSSEPAATEPSTADPAVTETLWVPPPTFTPRPSYTPPPESTQTPTLSPTPAAFRCAFDPQTPIMPGEPISQAILFLVPMHQSPLLETGVRRQAPAASGGTAGLDLWAVSLDGRRLGQVTQDQQGVALYISPEPPHTWNVFSATPLSIASDRVRRVPLPPVCQPPAQIDPDDPWYPCRDFRFSSRGSWVAFRWGGAGCGSGLALMDAASGELWADGTDAFDQDVHWFRFGPAGDLLLGLGGCQEGDLLALNPQTGDQRVLGPDGEVTWNASESAFAVEAPSYTGWERAVWGYDLEAGARFMDPAWQLNDRPLWAPDGVRLLYQHRPLTATAGLTATLGPRQIRLVDAASGEMRTLLGNPDYDYHLCTAAQACVWVGDWLPVRRVPFRPVELPPFEQADPSQPLIRCALEGQSCPEPVESLALNWRTGELAPWAEVPRPTPTPALTAPPRPTPAPDLNGEPFYLDPAGEYALYPGQDGHSLWCAPQMGEPVRWIATGWHFVLVPSARSSTASPTVMTTAGVPPSSTPSPTPTAAPTPFPSPTASPTVTMSATPVALKLAGPEISHDGVSFSLDPALGDGVFVDPEPGWLGAREFSFQPEGYCREVGCVTVYPVEAYREGAPFGGDILDSLQAAIETGSTNYFPTVGAAILLRAQTQHLRFQNGAGIRAIVMRGQDGFFANNEAVVYDFHGLSADGQYYVVVRVPVDAPILLSSYDPAENTNPAALPLPELPDDADQLIDVMREYNQEAERQLDLLDGASFVPDLGLLDALVGSLLVSPPSP